jgi:aspartate kinase
MQVFKFGGASIKDIERIENVINITRHESERPVLLVISAMGKTTNALEKVAEAFFEARTQEALQLFEGIKQQHLNLAKYLLVKEFLSFQTAFSEVVTEAEWLLHDHPVQSFDYYYDQIVCLGELFSTLLVAHAFRENGVEAAWIDVRDIIKTDDNFRDAGILWEPTRQQTETLLKPLLLEKKIVITQGFIGSTDENESTTLGREGSDFTAAIFANLLMAEKVTIWKDVDAVLSADPRLFPEALALPHLNYDEVVEMAYYGAQVIHPKTMKPLFNANIPLQVKSFLHPQLPGTRIDGKRTAQLPPMLVKKQNQVLMTFHTKDFSFVGEKPIGEWYLMLEKLHMRPNMIQNGAVRLMAVFDEHPEKIGQLAALAETIFDVRVQPNLSLFTIRHYNEDALQKYTGAFSPILTQKTRDTIQMVVSE